MSDRARIARLLARVTFRNPPFPIEVRVLDFWDGDREVRCAFDTTVPNRDGGGAIRVTHGFRVPLDPRIDDKRLLDLIYAEARRVFLHELDECFHVDGVRTRDPHASEQR